MCLNAARHTINLKIPSEKYLSLKRQKRKKINIYDWV
jgi:hypothetical protein